MAQMTPITADINKMRFIDSMNNQFLGGVTEAQLCPKTPLKSHFAYFLPKISVIWPKHTIKLLLSKK